jgi:hypothetical protein
MIVPQARAGAKRKRAGPQNQPDAWQNSGENAPCRSPHAGSAAHFPEFYQLIKKFTVAS